MICRSSKTTAVCALSILLMVGAAAGEEGEEGSKKAVASAQEPEFTKESSKKSFEQGKALFAEGKFKEADALFKKVKTDAKEKADKEAVEKWVQGAAGGLILEKLKLQVNRGVLATHDQAENIGLKYRGTPAEDLFRKYLDELEGQIYVPVEYFDTQSVRYSPKFGKTFVSDPKRVFQGAQCLQWTNTKDRKASALQFEMVPRNWNEFQFLELWVNLTVPPPGPEVVVFSGEDPAKAKAKAKTTKKKGQAKPASFFHAVVKLAGSSGQWQKVRIPINATELMPQGGPSLESVTSFQIQVPSGSQFNLLVDKVSLIKKEEAPGAKASKASEKPSAKGKKTP
jgi:hypothetical protein